MFSVKPDRKWSDIGLASLIASMIILVILIFADAFMKSSGYDFRASNGYVFLATLVVDFRYLFEQLIYAATIFFVGAKFFETRSILTLGFDKLDHSKVVVKGPDENNTVWVGRRYGTSLEAEAIAATFAERLKESAAVDAE